MNEARKIDIIERKVREDRKRVYDLHHRLDRIPSNSPLSNLENDPLNLSPRPPKCRCTGSPDSPVRPATTTTKPTLKDASTNTESVCGQGADGSLAIVNLELGGVPASPRRVIITSTSSSSPTHHPEIVADASDAVNDSSPPPPPPPRFSYAAIQRRAEEEKKKKKSD